MADMVDILLANALEDNDPSESGISDITIDDGELVVTLSDGRVINAGFIDKYPTYDTMPSTEDLLVMSSGTIFKTLGFYNEKDGHGGYYLITTSATTARGGLKLNNEGTIKYLIALDMPQGKATNYIDVCRYGVREYGIGTVDFSAITVNNTYAHTNSDIMSRMAEGGRGSYFQFPIGRFFFESPLSFTGNNTYGIRGSSSPCGTISTSYTGYGQSVGATTLYFPFLTDGQVAITVANGNIENIALMGNPNTYNFAINRVKVVTAPDEAITETIATSSGNDVKCTGISKTGNGFIKNVNVFNFYLGVTVATGNIYISCFYARACHTGLSIGNDIKCVGIYGWAVHTLLEFRGSIASAVQVRIDSCVNAIRIINGNAITLTDVDGDFCTDSLIIVGNGTNGKIVQQCVFTGIHGRCCAFKAFDSTQTTSPDVRSLADTSGYGIIRVENGCTFQDNQIVANRIGNVNPFDGKPGEPTNYKVPNIVLTFGNTNTVVRRNQFSFSDSSIVTDIDILKSLQVKSGVTARLDLHNRTYYIDGSVVTEEKIFKPIDEYIEQYHVGVNVKEYGATGDGTTDDSQAFIDAISDAYSQGKTTIIVPKGSYNLNNVDVTISTSFSFIGEDPELTKVLNSNITADHGIECIGITFDGGTVRTFDTSYGADYRSMPKSIQVEEVIILCTPTVDAGIHYKNCVFRNSGTASFAYKIGNGETPNAKFTTDLVENCVFENLVTAGIYHSLQIDDGRYIGNTFRNMGSETDYETRTSGYAVYCCLKCGDTSNTTTNHIKYGLFKDNVFENLLTRTHTLEELALERQDEQTYGHRDEGYFIGVHGEIINVFNNTFKNQMGYAHDREGLYVKPKESAYIHDNYFENAGIGEGYICCKQSNSPYDSRKVKIHNNTFHGQYGTAIAMYAEGDIFDNYINISNCKQAIWASSGSGKYLKIYRNIIDCGVDEFYLWDTLYTEYYRSAGTMVVKVTSYRKVYISDNKVKLYDNLTTASKNGIQFKLISVQSVTENFECCDNLVCSNKWNQGIAMVNVDSTDQQGNIILLTDDFRAVVNRNKTIINPESVSANHYAQPIRIHLVNDGVKDVEVLDNTITYSEKSEDGVRVTTKTDGRAYNNNISTVKFDTKQTDATFAYSAAKHLLTDADYVEVKDESWLHI